MARARRSARPRTAIASAHGVRTCRVLGDLTDAGQVAEVVRAVEAALGAIDILVHNAGGDIAAAGGKPDPNDALMIKEADVRAVLERNLLSTILVCQQVARGMAARRRGRILTISSIAAFRGRGRRRDLRHRESRRRALHALPRRPAARRTTSPSTRSRRATPAPAASSRRARSTRSASPRRARSSGSAPSTRSRAWSSSSPGRSARSSRARCCASTAARNAGRGEAPPGGSSGRARGRQQRSDGDRSQRVPHRRRPSAGAGLLGSSACWSSSGLTRGPMTPLGRAAAATPASAAARAR